MVKATTLAPPLIERPIVSLTEHSGLHEQRLEEKKLPIENKNVPFLIKPNNHNFKTKNKVNVNDQKMQIRRIED